ncbi:heparinase II/III domain-containing protein [Pasteurella multocida]|uniref:heparinase II/III domain-containing protein n=1 Tax=Pasteurella multocida TaxID=747 RepID=UPI00244CAD99|nr:heparinase II/III family protein [Pasteurella multocida]MDH3003318.1 hypothetical protein [Pasteurella multocida]
MLLPKDRYSDYIGLRDKDITPKWKKIEPVDEKHYKAITPNNISIELSNEVNTTFDVNKTPQYQSTMLWYHSLAWLRIIFKDHQNFALVNEFIDAYDAFMNSHISDKIFSTLTSRDHLVAEQIKNLTYLLAQDDERFRNKEKTFNILSKLVNWAILPNSIADNNHGMMLASSLLHIPLFIKMDSLIDNRIVDLASARLTEIVEGAFDSYGLCNENTPIYQNFYIRFLKHQINELAFLEKYDERYVSISYRLTNILKIAEQTLTLIALPTGELPPLGDGNANVGKIMQPLDCAEFYSPESGFYSVKHKRLRSRYFSFKCGYSSVVHKHSDDTSIYYWYDGQPIIMDAGFLNYDWTDPKNVLVKSQRGHSGAFYKKFDHLYPATLYRNSTGNNRAISSIALDKSDNLNIITGEVTIDDTYTVNRTVKFSHLNNILITDTFSSNDKSAEKCVRFLVPKYYDLTHKEEYILISGKNFDMQLRYTKGEAVIKCGMMENGIPTEGWIVDKPFESLTECYVIEIILDKNTNYVNTNLLMLEKE